MPSSLSFGIFDKAHVQCLRGRVSFLRPNITEQFSLPFSLTAAIFEMHASGKGLHRVRAAGCAEQLFLVHLHLFGPDLGMRRGGNQLWVASVKAQARTSRHKRAKAICQSSVFLPEPAPRLVT